MTSLKVLDLSDSFQGDVQIPTTLGNLCNLHTLVLSYLNLSLESAKLGRIFSGCLKHSLVELDLSHTSFNIINNSTLPPWLYKLSRLEHLNLHSNALQDRDIPANIGDFMSSLKSLDLSYNDPGLSLPTTLGNLCKLQELSRSGLNLRSKEATKFEQIFSGCIVQSLRKLSSVETYLQGDMPDWIGGLKNLQMLDLSSNQINSTLPALLFNLTTISHLDLSHNDFHGSILSLFENMISLEILYLGANSHLEGPIPVTLGCIRNSLQWLVLLNTSLGGHFPDEIGNLKSLVWLDIGQNSISGSIPTTIGCVDRRSFGNPF
ncbi:hypothetical protein J5N97_028977 [Dioscorea zingiberensis]|uniref:non-specific serine/threonine protein kinase n=1 Tax=Dioscorea zingiberensis TaxID=325984 RepID=A0A9D5H5H2_9LILI|nr:hypothetical protein J5N97_028977 [Dioscorea zingiberensis]